MCAGTYPDEVSGTMLANATLPLEAEPDPPRLRKQIEAEVDDNPEHVDFYDAFKEAGALLDDLPDIPITYVFASLQKLPPEWADGAYERALHEFVDGLPHGRIVRVKSSHDLMLQEVPDEIASEIRRML